MKTRHLKVRETERDYMTKKSRGYATTSFILLKGNWLEEAGFTKDTPVSVIVQKNCLVLTPVESD